MVLTTSIAQLAESGREPAVTGVELLAWLLALVAMLVWSGIVTVWALAKYRRLRPLQAPLRAWQMQRAAAGPHAPAPQPPAPERSRRRSGRFTLGMAVTTICLQLALAVPWAVLHWSLLKGEAGTTELLGMHPAVTSLLLPVSQLLGDAVYLCLVASTVVLVVVAVMQRQAERFMTAVLEAPAPAPGGAQGGGIPGTGAAALLAVLLAGALLGAPAATGSAAEEASGRLPLAVEASGADRSEPSAPPADRRGSLAGPPLRAAAEQEPEGGDGPLPAGRQAALIINFGLLGLSVLLLVAAPVLRRDVRTLGRRVEETLQRLPRPPHPAGPSGAPGPTAPPPGPAGRF